MSDREPYTVEEAEFLHKHDERASSRKLLATVEALERVTTERDEARADAEHHKKRADMLRCSLDLQGGDIARAQREACAARVRHLDADPDIGFTSAEILATPLVTDGGGE